MVPLHVLPLSRPTVDMLTSHWSTPRRPRLPLVWLLASICSLCLNLSITISTLAISKATRRGISSTVPL